MNKYARISVYFILVSIFIFFVISLLIVPSGSSVDVLQQSTPKITRTASTETSCNNGVCTKTLYSGTMFDNSNGTWLPLSEVMGFKWLGNEFSLYYKNNPNINLTLQPYFNYVNGNNYTVKDIKSIFPNAKLKDKIQLGNFNYKFALNLTVPQNLVDNTNYIAFKLTEVNGLTWSDLKIENKTVIIKGKYRMDFNDLIESGFILTRVGKEFRIGNLSANYVNGTLYLDPTIQLQDADTENSDDTWLDQNNPDIINGADTFLSMYKDDNGLERSGLLKFNISTIPLNQIIDSSEICLYAYSNGLDSGESFNISSHHFYNITWDEDTTTWNTLGLPNLNPSSDDMNLTDEEVILFNSSSPIGWYCWNSTNIVNTEYTDNNNFTSVYLLSEQVTGLTSFVDDIEFRSKEYATDTTLRPYLNITYTLTPPTLVTPINNSWNNSLTVDFTCSSTSDSLKNITFFAYNSTDTINDTENQSITGTSNSSTFNIILPRDDTYEWNCFYCDEDDRCIFANSNFTLNIDTTFPLIDFGTGTDDDQTNFTRSNIYVNVTVTETNEDTITFLLYNQTAQVNSTSFTDSTRTINWTSLPDEVYTYNVTINDSAGNSNTTTTRTIRLDNNPPSVTIAQPKAQTYPSNNSLPLNYSVSDTVVGVDSCWFNVINSTSDSQISNTIITDCLNTTFGLVGVSDNYTLTLFSNDSLGQENSDSVIFSVSLASPSVVLDYPPDNQAFNNGTDIYFNFTATDSDGLDTCQLYGDWTGTWHINYTWVSPTNATQNFTVLNVTEDSNSVWNVFCNDTANNGGFAQDNSTIIVDTIDPLITIQSITTAQGSQTFSFNATMTDANQDSCWYSVFDSTGAIDSVVNENTTCTFGISNSETVSEFGTYNLTVYGNDSAGNENSTTQSFTVSQLTSTGGGGGGNPIEQIPFIGLQETDSSVMYDDLERGIIYATINNYCSEKITNEPFAIEDLSSTCQLTETDLQPLIEKLNTFNLQITPEDLKLFIKVYHDKLFFQGSTSRSNADKFSLFVSQLGLTTLLQLNPPSIDKIVSLYEPDGKERTIPLTITSNKPLKSCQIISETPNLNCVIEDGNIVKLNYKLDNTNFASRVFSGLILLTTDAPSDKIEQSRVSISIRVINLGNSIFRNVGIIVIVSLVGGFFFIKKKTRNKLLKQARNITSLS